MVKKIQMMHKRIFIFVWNENELMMIERKSGEALKELLTYSNAYMEIFEIKLKRSNMMIELICSM